MKYKLASISVSRYLAHLLNPTYLNWILHRKWKTSRAFKFNLIYSVAFGDSRDIQFGLVEAERVWEL